MHEIEMGHDRKASYGKINNLSNRGPSLHQVMFSMYGKCVEIFTPTYILFIYKQLCLK